MTIASEIQRIKNNIADAYNAAEAKGATMPATENSDSLATTIESITGGGGEQVEGKNYTGSTIAEGAKVWINPYHYEAGTTTTASSYIPYNSSYMYPLDNDVIYVKNSNYLNYLYHKDGTQYTGVNLGFYTSYANNITFEPNGNVYVYGIKDSPDDGLYHIITHRIDTGLIWSKTGYIPIHNSNDLLVKAYSASDKAIVKINPDTGADIFTWDLSNSGIDLSYWYSGNMGNININHHAIAINNNTILLNNGNSAYRSALRQIILNNDGTVTVTSPTVSTVINQSPCYDMREYMNGYLFKDLNYAPCVYDITDLSNIVNKTIDLGLPSSNYCDSLVFRADKNHVLYISAYQVYDTSHSSKVIKINPITRQGSEVALDYIALCGNENSARCCGFTFNGDDISDCCYFYNSNGYINHITETTGNNLVTYKSGLITQDTQTGTAAEIISAGSTGLVNVNAVIEPTGSITITTNGTHNVADYAEAVVNVDSSVYPGLVTQYYKADSLIPFLDISSGAFKDYTVNYESAKGSLGTVGNDYITGKNQNGRFYNGIINHGCTVTDEGLVTGFETLSSTQYKAVNLTNAFPSSISQFKVIIKAKLNSGSQHAVLFAVDTTPERYIGIRNSTNLAMYNSGWTQGSTTISKEVWYWYCATFDGTTTICYLLEDNNYTLDTLPQLSQWSQEFTTNSNIWAGNTFIFGLNPFSNQENFKYGTIDLGNTSIEVNNEPFYNWEMTSPTAITATGILKSGLSDTGNATSYNLYYDGSYELDTGTQESHFGGVVEVPTHTVETPIVANFKVADFLSYDTAKKGFSMFSADNYIEAKYKFNVTSAQWTSGVKIQVHFKTQKYYDGYTDYKPLFFANFRDNPIYDYNYGMQLHLERGTTPWFVLSDANGNRYFSLSGSSLQDNTEYWLRIVNPTSGAPYMELSTDGLNWSTVATYSSSVSISDITSTENLKLAVGTAINAGNVGVFNGTIYAEDTFIEINNQRVWSMV